MKKLFMSNLVAITLLAYTISEAQTLTRDAGIEFDAYEKLVAEVKQHRNERLITLDRFIEMSKVDDVIILDARSEKMYVGKHIKGAVNLNFSEFTQENLAKIIPSTESKILIYCNNNFEDDQVFFATKMFVPDLNSDIPETEPVMLALNIPTYINLYGYGYRNIYELSEMISVFDTRLEFEGTSVVSR